MRLRCWLYVGLTLALSNKATSATTNAPFVREEILFVQELYNKDPKMSIDQVLVEVNKRFPNVFKRPVLMFKSNSLQKDAVSFENPRVILSSKDGGFFMAFTGNVPARASDSVEMVEYNPGTKLYSAAELTQVNGKLQLDLRPSKCAACHGEPFRPIWDAYDLWPGAHAGDNSSAFSEKDREAFKQFLLKRKTNPRYRLLNFEVKTRKDEPQKELDPPKLSIEEREHQAYYTPEAPTSDLSSNISASYLPWLTGQLESNDHFSPFKAAFVAAASLCPDFSRWLPKGAVPKGKLSYLDFKARIKDKLEEKLKARMARAASAVGEEKLELYPDGFTENEMAPALWVLYLAGIPYESLTFGVDREEPAFLAVEPAQSFPFGVAARMMSQDHVEVKTPEFSEVPMPVWKDLYKAMPIFEDYKLEDHLAACKKLEPTLNLLKKGIALPAPATPSTKSPAKSPKTSKTAETTLCLASRFKDSERDELKVILANCASCHDGRNEIPFLSAPALVKSLRMRPRRKSSIKATIGDEVLHRLFAQDPDRIMPPNEPPAKPMSLEQKHLLQRYFNACMEAAVLPESSAHVAQ